MKSLKIHYSCAQDYKFCFVDQIPIKNVFGVTSTVYVKLLGVIPAGSAGSPSCFGMEVSNTTS